MIETNSPQNGELNSSYTKRASELKSSRTQKRKSVQETDTSDTRKWHERAQARPRRGSWIELSQHSHLQKSPESKEHSHLHGALSLRHTFRAPSTPGSSGTNRASGGMTWAILISGIDPDGWVVSDETSKYFHKQFANIFSDLTTFQRFAQISDNFV